MKGYTHTEFGIKDGDLLSRIRLTTLQFRGRNVLVRHFTGDEVRDPFVMVTGYVAGAMEESRDDDLPVTQVVPVVDNAERSELTALIRFFMEVPAVHFWG